MADDFAIDVSGLQEMADKVRTLPQTLARGAFALGFIHAAAVLAPALTSACPDRSESSRDENSKHLADCIGTEIAIDRDGTGGRLWIGFKGNIGNFKASDIALWLEYGHRMVGHAPNLAFHGKFVAPFPFIRAAWDQSIDEAVQAFVDAVDEALPAALENVA
jgi:hypothetical protein